MAVRMRDSGLSEVRLRRRAVKRGIILDGMVMQWVAVGLCVLRGLICKEGVLGKKEDLREEEEEDIQRC